MHRQQGWRGPRHVRASLEQLQEPEPAPASTASPERRRLAAAIDQHRRAISRLTWLQRGGEELQRRSYEASAAIETAEAVLAEVRKSAADRPVYVRLLAGGADEEDEVVAAER